MEEKNYKIKVNNLPEIDFSDFMGMTDGYVSTGEYLKLIRGEKVKTSLGEIDPNYIGEYMVIRYFAEHIDKYVKTFLSGWGGREIVAYRDAFLFAVGYYKTLPTYLTENNEVKIINK